MSYYEFKVRPAFSWKRLGNKLKKLRKENNIDAKAVAINVGVAYATYYNWESGRKCPNLQSLIRLASIYDVSIDYLLDRNELEANAVKVRQYSILSDTFKAVSKSLDSFMKEEWKNWYFSKDKKLKGYYSNECAIYTLKKKITVDKAIG